MTPGRCGCDFKSLISKHVFLIDILSVFYKIASFECYRILVQVISWYHQILSHYLKWYWPRYLKLYIITRPQWVNRQQLRWTAMWSSICHWNNMKWIMTWKHDEVISWKCIPHYWPFVNGNPKSPMEFSHKGPALWNFDLLLWFPWTTWHTISEVIWDALTLIMWRHPNETTIEQWFIHLTVCSHSCHKTRCQVDLCCIMLG